MITPGMKVAERVKTAPHMLALGKVTPDGNSVIWHDIIDMADGHAHHSHYGNPMRFAKTPVPLRGDEVPCPPELAHLIP
jgi:hypothetical protein